MRWISLISGGMLLTASLALAGQPRALGSQELQVRIEALAAPPRSHEEAVKSWPRVFSRLQRTQKPQPAPKPPRSEEIGPDQWLLRAYDAQGNQRYWYPLADPRVVRAELPPPGQTTGELQGVEVIADQAEFLVAVPDDPAIVELRIYQPRWTGDDYVLDLLGTVPVR